MKDKSTKLWELTQPKTDIKETGSSIGYTTEETPKNASETQDLKLTALDLAIIIDYFVGTNNIIGLERTGATRYTKEAREIVTNKCVEILKRIETNND
jgi:hypothetical protein